MNYKDKLKQLIQADGNSFVFCDVGARWGLEWLWQEYDGYIDVIAFEPDKEESENLRKSHQVISKCLSDTNGQVDLHLLKSRGCSSLLMPNTRFLNSFPDCDRFKVELTETLDCVTLDFLKQTDEIDDIDFIKIDTQGTELSILKGGESLLQNVVGIQVEVEFHQMYQDQPLFADVDMFVRNKIGLEMQDLRKTFWKYKVGKKAMNAKGKLILVMPFIVAR